MSFVNNENILQACATVFAGVLILLTFERKFEAKDVAPEYILKLNRERDEVSSYVKKQENERERANQKITDVKRRIEEGKEDPRMLTPLEDELAAIKERIEKAENSLTLTKTMISQVQKQQMVSKEVEKGAQRLKDIEGFVTLITLALFSLCIVFMILVDTRWNYYIFNYSFVSKLLFSIALLVLLVRVYLRSKEFKT